MTRPHFFTVLYPAAFEYQSISPRGYRSCLSSVVVCLFFKLVQSVQLLGQLARIQPGKDAFFETVQLIDMIKIHNSPLCIARPSNMLGRSVLTSQHPRFGSQKGSGSPYRSTFRFCKSILSKSFFIFLFISATTCVLLKMRSTQTRSFHPQGFEHHIARMRHKMPCARCILAWTR